MTERSLGRKLAAVALSASLAACSKESVNKVKPVISEATACQPKTVNVRLDSGQEMPIGKFTLEGEGEGRWIVRIPFIRHPDGTIDYSSPFKLEGGDLVPIQDADFVVATGTEERQTRFSFQDGDKSYSIRSRADNASTILVVDQTCSNPKS